MRRKGTSNSSLKIVKARRDSVTNIHVWSYNRCGRVCMSGVTRHLDNMTHLNFTTLQGAEEDVLQDTTRKQCA